MAIGIPCDPSERTRRAAPRWSTRSVRVAPWLARRSGRGAGAGVDLNRLFRNLLAVAVALSVAVRGVHATPNEQPPNDDDAIASRLFNEGRVLAEDHRWPEACAKFEDSLHRDPALGTSLNLATCYEKVGKLGRAWQLYRNSVELAERAGNLLRRDFAQTRADALVPRLAKLVISSPGKRRAGLVVTWDGRPLDGSQQRTTLYTDAGLHRLIASAPGYRVFVKRVTLVAGKTQTVKIPDLLGSHPRDSEPAAGPIGDLTGNAAAVIGKYITRSRVTIGLGAIGLSATTVGLVFGARASARYDDAKALCPGGSRCGPVSRDRYTALIRDARSNAIASTVLVAAGGAATLTSAVLFLTRPRSLAGATASIVPIVHDGEAGLALSGRF
jgi:hypothetical protein